MNGIEILKALRQENVFTPVLMLTAKSELDDKILGLENGADDYLTKPFEFEELVARIKALGRRHQNFELCILKHEDLSIDTNNFKVTRNNNEIELSRKEFALLEYLMRHDGQILTKVQLIAHVWDYDSDVLPNTVEVYMGYLRNKVDRAFKKEKPLIETVRGFGYKIGNNNV